VYGGKRSFDPHLADGEVQRGTPQWISTMWKGTFSARYGRTGELHHRGLAFAEGNSPWDTGQNVEVGLDRAGPVVP
jgi:hypothetical protein